MPRREGLRPISEQMKKIRERVEKERERKKNKNKPVRIQPKLPGMKKGGMKNPDKVIKSIKPTLGRKKTEEFLRKLKDKKKKMGGGMLKYKKGGMFKSKENAELKKQLRGTLIHRPPKEEFLRKLKDKKKKMGGGMLKYKKGGFPDLSGDGKTTMKDVLIGRGVIKKKSGGSIDKNVRVIDLQKQGKTSKKGIRVKGKGKSFMDVYKKTVYNRADGGMVPFGGEKRVPGSGAATRGTGFKGIF
jgi:hypothetical protein